MKEYIELFMIFAKIGAFTIGGGLAMIPFIREEIVVKKHWIDDDEFVDIIAISQSLPGILVVNVSIFLGYRLKGVKGSLASTLGSILPSILIILAIAMFFSGYRDNQIVNAAFKGIRPVVVALIAVPVVQLAIKNKLNIFTGALAFASLVLIVVGSVSPVYILLTVGVCAACFAMIKESQERDKEGRQ